MPYCRIRLKAQIPKGSAYPKELRTIGDHLRAKRLDLGLKQRELAKTIGATESAVVSWEKSGKTPSLPYMPAIIAFLGYSPVPLGESLAERLRGFRKTHGYTQKELARQLEVDPCTLAKWERGERHPDSPYQERIERLFMSLSHAGGPAGPTPPMR